MKTRIPFYLACFSTLIIITGCSINRPVTEDYGQYLANNQGETKLQRAKIADKYNLSPETQNHRYEFRSVLAGHANLWIVEFGKILDATMASRDVIAALGALSKASGQDIKTGDVLAFTLKEYQFTDHAAQITLDIAVKRDGSERFNKTYSATGHSQGGKMFWGGVFGMKNAVQQSTKSALDKILSDFIKDVTHDLPDTAIN